jgi:monofunctional biosynthetic peptidoglycan transglycosylase
MILRCIEQKSDGKKITLTKNWRSLEKISPVMPLAVIAAEDQNFEEHFGFDLEAIKKAEAYNDKTQWQEDEGSEYDYSADGEECFFVAIAFMDKKRI